MAGLVGDPPGAAVNVDGGGCVCAFSLIHDVEVHLNFLGGKAKDQFSISHSILAREKTLSTPGCRCSFWRTSP
jgi:hypothetical protein